MKKTELSKKEIQELRLLLGEKLIKYKGKKHIKIDIEPYILEQIIFTEEIEKTLYCTYKNNGMTEEQALEQATYKNFAIHFNLLRKLDFTDISFDNVDVSRKNFSGTKGIKINPQTVAFKNFWYTTLTDVEIVGPFDECDIVGAIFKGCTGAKINPQTVRNKDLLNTVLVDAEIIGLLDNCRTEGTVFSDNQAVTHQLKSRINEAFKRPKRKTLKKIFRESIRKQGE